MNSFAGTTQTGGRAATLRNALRRAGTVSRPLTLMGGAMILLFLAVLAGIFMDHRVITGVPAWLKPAKFALSVSVYCFTFVWLLGFVENRPRLVRWVANVTVVSFIVEMTAIVTQAARGTTSHFNMTTPFNSLLWITMGTFIAFVWAMNLALAVALIFEQMSDRAFAWSLRLGVLISALGMAVAFFMVRPTSEQVAVIASGHGPRIVGGHSVGVADGGPGLAVVGWSTVGGDLRVAHFFGLHGLQVLPFLGWLVTRRKGALARLSADDRMVLVWISGLGYLGLVLLFLWQALRGQSLIHPDSRTIAVATALGTALAALILIVVARVLHRTTKTRALVSQNRTLSPKEGE